MLPPAPRRRLPAARVAGLVATGVLLAAGCSATGPTAPARPAARLAAPTAVPSATPTCVPAPLAERAASVLVVGLPGVTSAGDPLAQEVTGLGVGGVFLAHDNVRTGPQLEQLVTGLRAAARRPLLVSTDEESGRVAVVRDVVGPGPSPRRLAEGSSPAQVRGFARQLGTRLAGLGIDLDLAPVADLDDGPAQGIVGDRSFSAAPGSAARYALAFAAGLQDAGVRPVLKHFPGEGRSDADPHRTDAVVGAPVAELRRTDLVPFARAVAAGAPVVMVNHLQYASLDRGLPATLSPRAYALLRQLGFQGVAMTDSVGMGAVNLRWDFPEAAVRAVAAGADAVLATDGRQARPMRDALVAAVRSGRLPQARLDEAAARVAALAGADPVALACRPARSPRLVLAPPGSPTPSTTNTEEG